MDVFGLQRAVWDSGLDPLDRLVLLAIVSYWSAESPEPYPSWSALMQRTGLSRATLARRLQSLTRAGVVRVTVRQPPKGMQPTNHYDLTGLTRVANQSRSETSLGAKPVSERDADQSQSETSTSLRVRPEVSSDLSKEERGALSLGSNPSKGTKPKPPKSAKPRRGTLSHFAPDDFAPLDVHRAKAAELRVDLEEQLAKFRVHEFKTAKSDWSRAFTNWLLQARDYANKRAAGGAPRPTAAPDAGVKVIRSLGDLR